MIFAPTVLSTISGPTGDRKKVLRKKQKQLANISVKWKIYFSDFDHFKCIIIYEAKTSTALD